MTTSTDAAVDDVRYDPYDVVVNADPYPTFARLREEAPLYYNAEHDFYAVSRFADVDKALVDHATFSSARGIIIELIKADLEIPHAGHDVMSGRVEGKLFLASDESRYVTSVSLPVDAGSLLK